MNNQMRREILGEVLFNELRSIREYVQDIPVIKSALESIIDDLIMIKTDVKAIKAVIRIHDREIKQLKQKVA